jgi:hypothetical protein
MAYVVVPELMAYVLHGAQMNKMLRADEQEIAAQIAASKRTGRDRFLFSSCGRADVDARPLCELGVRSFIRIHFQNSRQISTRRA